MASAPALTRRPAVALVAVLALVAGLLAGVRAAAGAAAAVPAQPYTWRNAEVVGGGFVPGIVFNEGERGLVHARTDIGGAYRLDAATGRWVPLLDWVGWDRWGRTGVLSLAVDPVDTGRVHAAVGTYSNSWDPGDGAILRSAGRGRTWQAAELPFELGGNMPGRGMGERLAVDPHRNATVYSGAPAGHGLWRSPDDPTGYASEKQGIVWVTFDPRSGSPGAATRTIYVAGRWSGGFQGEVRVRNAGAAAVRDWRLTWSFPDGQRVTQSWGTTVTATGAGVTAVPADRNATIAPGASVTFGFIGTWSGANREPPAFALDGSARDVA